jgi:hypothetical protein
LIAVSPLLTVDHHQTLIKPQGKRRSSVAAKNKKRLRVLSGQIGDRPEKKPGVPAKTREESLTLPEVSGNQPTRRFMKVAEQAKAKAAGVDFTEIAKVWKEAYLDGLEAGLRWQGENEHAAKSIIKQGLMRSQQLLALSEDCLDKSLEQIQGHESENPFVALSRQLIQASHTVAEPVLKTGAEVYETTVNTYETALAGPARRSVLDINKQVMDTIIPN